jgi:hypothetical protein
MALASRSQRLAPLGDAGSTAEMIETTRFVRVRAHLEAVRIAAGPRAWLYEFLLFGFKQGWACLFGGLMLALLLGTAPGRPVYLVRGEYWHLRQRMELSRSAGRMAYGVAGQAGCLVPADDHQLCAGVKRARRAEERRSDQIAHFI